MAYKAVIFDLFGTLVRSFSEKEFKAMLGKMASVLEAPGDDFVNLWIETYNAQATGKEGFRSIESTIEYCCRVFNLDCDPTKINEASRIRFDYTRVHMKPWKDVLPTLSELRRRRLKIGLITDCTPELPLIWPETPLVSVIDNPSFSCNVGIKKPDRRIYHLSCKNLDVRPQECLYVGDGSSDELSGATHAGLNPVGISIPEEQTFDAYRINKEEWVGLKVSSIGEILHLVA